MFGRANTDLDGPQKIHCCFTCSRIRIESVRVSYLELTVGRSEPNLLCNWGRSVSQSQSYFATDGRSVSQS